MGPTQCDWFVTLNKLTTTLTVSSRDKIPIPDVLNPSIIPTLRDRDQTFPASQYSLWSQRRAAPMRAETQSALCAARTRPVRDREVWHPTSPKHRRPAEPSEHRAAATGWLFLLFLVKLGSQLRLHAYVHK